jgi:hypothetical protein
MKNKAKLPTSWFCANAVHVIHLQYKTTIHFYINYLIIDSIYPPRYKLALKWEITEAI